MKHSKHSSKKQGFTLAELLISLTILAEIATFTIPKILVAQQNMQKRIVFKETIATFNQALYLYCLEPGKYSNMPLFDFIASKVNTVKQCNSNALSQGCSPATPVGGGEAIEPGFTLHNGASVAGFNSGLSDNEFVLDWNGLSGSNDATEQIRLAMNFTTTPDWLGVKRCTVIQKHPLSHSIKTRFNNQLLEPCLSFLKYLSVPSLKAE